MSWTLIMAVVAIWGLASMPLAIAVGRLLGGKTMARSDLWGNKGHYAKHPDRCQTCRAAAPYWKNYPVRAQWWFGRDGSIFCPAHVPAWVATWRARQASIDAAW